MKTPLKIPKNKTFPGLVVYCVSCNANVYDNCRQTGQTLKNCPKGEKHRFKLYFQPKGANKRITKTFDTRDLDMAITQAIAYKNEWSEKKYLEKTEPENKDIINKPEKKHATPTLLIHLMAKYIGFLNNEGVPSHRVKERSTAHIKNVEHSFKIFYECLSKAGYSVNTFRYDQIDDRIIGDLFTFLTEEKQFSNRTFNKYFSYFTSFATWAKKQGYGVQNFFEEAPRKKIRPNPQAINKEEFDNLIKATTLENGVSIDKNNIKRNYYRDWLPFAFRLALTGARREELINLKFSDCVTDKEGNIIYMECPDIKVNRQQGVTNKEDMKIKYLPVSKDLAALLYEMSYEEHKNTDTYILAPGIRLQRNKVMADALSKGFQHFYSKLNTERHLTFKSIRKAFITSVSLFTGGNAKMITGHSDDAVIQKHYLDQKVIAKSFQNFEVFPSENNEDKRISELNNVREQSKNNQINLEK